MSTTLVTGQSNMLIVFSGFNVFCTLSTYQRLHRFDSVLHIYGPKCLC